MNSRSYPSVDVDSDHQLVMANIRLRFKVTKRVKTGSKRKHDLGKLQSTEVLAAFQEEVRRGLTHQDSLDNDVAQLSQVLRQAADKVLGFQKMAKKPWVKQETLDMIEERRLVKAMAVQDTSLKPRYNKLTRALRGRFQSDYESWCNKLCDEIEDLQKTHQVKLAHQKIALLTSNGDNKRMSHPICDKNGTLLVNDDEIRNRWCEYSKELYNTDLNVDPSTLDNLWSGQPSEELPNILRSEVEQAIHKLNNGKAVGIDGVASELIKGGGDAVVDKLHDICVKAWKEGTFPAEWCKSIIVPLPKKGDNSRCENYRTLSLIPHASKVLLEILRNRLKPYIEEKLSNTQAGFRTGRSTIEQIFVWKQLAERYLETQNGCMVNVFIDFKKAFDRVWHLGLVRVLKHYNIPPELCVLIQSLYGQAVSAVRVGADVSEWFPQTVGVRQGCLLSPDLFNLFLEHVLSEAKSSLDDNCGVLANGLRVSDLAFADDIDVMTETVSAAQEYIDSLNDKCHKYGMQINKEKSKTMVVSKEPQAVHIMLDGIELQQVTQFKYLGSNVCQDNASATDIRARLAQGMAALAGYQKVWDRYDISLQTKLRLLDTTVIPTAIYGCENWTILKHDRLKIGAFGMKCLRRILNIHWSQKIRNVEVAKQAGRNENFLTSLVDKKQKVWLGHVLRMEGDRLPKVSLQACSLGKLTRGGQKPRWIDAVLKNMGMSLQEALALAQDRYKWRILAGRT